ncbi:hypothetical protein PR202_ga04459 [Eleusine coracana subsp. coracana]|uniref:Uncharacterized protein n=1 Tax=Eleusine coracana subsp. coracana TaxID=191504 RepID=A0AAV5BQE0_ELECO|nr:hypothetical protein PR202_ga04459 [Eleusine coracana subsp. coracana]
MGYEEGELELEEGEAAFCGGAAYGYRYGGGDTVEVVDLNTFTYIDEKLQYLLGCFQKKFEGEISAENLGSQYGGYGSFIAKHTHIPSPLVLSESRSPVVPPPHQRSPYVPMEVLFYKVHFMLTY